MNPDDRLLDPAWDRDDVFAEPDDAEADDFWLGYPEAREIVYLPAEGGCGRIA